MTTLHVTPVPGARVRDPNRRGKPVIPVEGCRVQDCQYIRRRLRDGSLLLTSSAVAEPANERIEE